MIYVTVIENIVTNRFIWDGNEPYEADGLHIKVDEESIIGMGWRYEDGEFIPPEPEFVPVDANRDKQPISTIDDLLNKIDDLEKRLSALESNRIT